MPASPDASTRLAPDLHGRTGLWPVRSGLPGMLPHAREAATIHRVPDGVLTIAHAWGLPGEAFAARSCCDFHALGSDHA